MRSIAVLNQKGGVGKTTTAVNLSAALAATGQRVCLIDLDPQAHATLHLGLQPARDERSMYDVLTGDAELADVWRETQENLWVAGSHIDLAAAEVELVGVVGREVILRDKLARASDAFDFVFIDCPPSLGILTLNALAAVDEVFLPLQPHFLALHGLSKLLQTIDLVSKRLNDRLKLSGVVYCMYDTGTRLAAEVTNDVEQFLQSTAPAAHPLGRDPYVPDADSPQHSPGRGAELRPIDLSLRPRVAGAGGLRATGPRSGRAVGGMDLLLRDQLGCQAYGIEPSPRRRPWPASGSDWRFKWRAWRPPKSNSNRRSC